MNSVTQAVLRSELVELCCAVAFLITGFTACAIAAIRQRAGVRVFLWLGVWSGSYGLMHLLGSQLFLSALPPQLQEAPRYINTILSYIMVVIASFAWLDLIVGVLRKLMLVLVGAAVVTAILGIGYFLATGVGDKFINFNNLIAVSLLAFLMVAVSSKRFFQRYLLLPNRTVLVLGTYAFALEALAANLLRPLGSHTPLLLDHLGFAVLLSAFGYSALRMVLSNEHRLLAIESELSVAREIQTSILPTKVPELSGIQIAAVYKPAASVAGDFYEFLPVDSTHAGIFVADVCGHGVPAALIASMLKVAVQSASPCADKPGEFLATMNRTLSEPLRGQLVSAAYLWIDAASRKACYSAAGHPPLLHWQGHRMETIESNGLLFGVLPDAAYPQTEIPLDSTQRLLLYTDGVSEPENDKGEEFGAVRLPQLLSSNGGSSACDVANRIVGELPLWHSTAHQQDDMTLVVVDVL